MVSANKTEQLRVKCISFALEAKGLINSVTGISKERSIEQIIKDAEMFYKWITKGK